jgi:hypothetical protein
VAQTFRGRHHIHSFRGGLVAGLVVVWSLKSWSFSRWVGGRLVAEVVAVWSLRS